MVSNVSVKEPIWFNLIKIALQAPMLMPFAKRSLLVTKKSSPTIIILLPIRLVKAA